MTPVPRDHRIGVPEAGTYQEIMNSDAGEYAGSGVGNAGRALVADELNWMNRPYSVVVTLPPLAGIVIKRVVEKTAVIVEAAALADESAADE
jgi:1,4-alpha-glucan branching enzyme